jgi:hypothetical protein
VSHQQQPLLLMVLMLMLDGDHDAVAAAVAAERSATTPSTLPASSSLLTSYHHAGRELTHLALDHNSIILLPESICDLSKLEHLEVSTWRWANHSSSLPTNRHA